MSWLDQKMSSQKVSYTLPTAMPNPFGDPPKKYAKSKSDKLMKLNPEWKKWKDEQQQKVQQLQQQQQPPGGAKQQPAAVASSGGAVVVPPFVPPQVATVIPTTMTITALPVVTSLADHAELNEISLAQGGKEMPLSESTNATIELFQQPDITKDTGLSADTAMDSIGEILSKYEVPIGLMNKLLILSQYDILEFIIDDSGSMVQFSDTIHAVTGKSMTRWEEAQSRLLEMMELLAHLPFQTICVFFLNRPTKLTFVRQGRSPTILYQTIMVPQINAAFTSQPPQGSTPFLEKLQSSFQTHQGKSVARWFFGDGVPNGGDAAQDKITQLLQQRNQPENNPVTFISCSNDDNEVLWMKDAEEVAPYVSEADDYIDEAYEVLKDQGTALPYTKGFHLVCQLVAASCPDDLDAMDESVPLSKPTLDNLLGLQHTETAYRYYFDAFLTAQKNRTVEQPAVDNWKKQMNWNSHYQDLLTANTSHQLAAVQQYRAELQRLEAVTATSK
jgi:flagellar motor protein MotB